MRAAHFDLSPFNPKPHCTQDNASRSSGFEEVMQSLGVCEGDLKEIESELNKKCQEASEGKTEDTIKY